MNTMLTNTMETVGEQLVGEKKENNQENVTDQFKGFWSDFRDQLFDNKSPEQIQQEAQQAQMSETNKTPQQLAAARKRIQEISTPAPQQPKEYEYRGPEMPQSSENEENIFAQQQAQSAQPQHQSILKNPETRR